MTSAWNISDLTAGKKSFNALGVPLGMDWWPVDRVLATMTVALCIRYALLSSCCTCILPLSALVASCCPHEAANSASQSNSLFVPAQAKILSSSKGWCLCSCLNIFLHLLFFDSLFWPERDTDTSTTPACNRKTTSPGFSWCFNFPADMTTLEQKQNRPFSRLAGPSAVFAWFPFRWNQTIRSYLSVFIAVMSVPSLVASGRDQHISQSSIWQRFSSQRASLRLHRSCVSPTGSFCSKMIVPTLLSWFIIMASAAPVSRFECALCQGAFHQHWQQ